MIRKGYGPKNARVMLVGEAYGSQEDKEKKPFVGPVGMHLRKNLLAVGIDPEECYFTNLINARPPENNLRAWFDDKGNPNNLVINGMSSLMDEIVEINPNVIVALGNFPAWALTRKIEWRQLKDRYGRKYWTYSGIHDWRGSILECVMPKGKKVIATFHPSYTYREGRADSYAWMADLQRIAKEQHFPEIRRPQKTFIIDPQGKDRWEVRDYLLSQPEQTLTFDIEYVGNKNLICVGMGFERDTVVCVPTRDPTDLEYVRSILTSGMKLNAQNSVYDCSILEWHYNMPVIQNLHYDTMVCQHAANIELPKGLDFLTSIYTDQPYYKDMIDWKKIKKGEQSIEDVYYYNCIDVWVQHEVMEEQILHELDDPDVLRTFRFEMALIRPLWEMSKRGVRIDTEQLAKYSKQLESDIRVQSSILELIAGESINVKSNPQVGKLLFEKFGLQPEKMNKTGPACDDKTLASIQSKLDSDSVEFKTITVIRKIREFRDLKSKFLDIQFDTDNRMRGHYDPSGTGTGRLNSRKFYPTGLGGNQQNIPKNKTVRRMFIPDNGWIFIYPDLERAESLVVAHLTMDPEMLRVHAPGMDAHTELAKEMIRRQTGEVVETITEEQRYILGKQTRHAGNYMQGPKTMSVNINKYTAKTGISVTVSECKVHLQTYREIHPFLQVWWNHTRQTVWNTKKLYNLLGRPRKFYGHVDGILPVAVAYVPQSTVGDTLNVGLLNIHGIPCDYMQELGVWPQYAEWAKELQFLGFEALMQVHDAFGGQLKLPMENVERGLYLINNLLKVPLRNPKTNELFTIPVEMTVGPSWGDVEKWTPPDE